MMNLKELKKPLEIKDIDFRIQSINKGGYATILAYKDARVDMNRLDAVCGTEYWKREHFDGNTKCRVSIWNSEIKEWVSKEDVGTESTTEKEKGLASDSFKRACFNWGIGRELYDYPLISIKLKSNEFELYTVKINGKDVKKAKQTWDLKLKEWVWSSVFIDDKLNGLVATDEKGNVRFIFKNGETKKITLPKVEVIKLPELLPTDTKNWDAAKKALLSYSKEDVIKNIETKWFISDENKELL